MGYSLRICRKLIRRRADLLIKAAEDYGFRAGLLSYARLQRSGGCCPEVSVLVDLEMRRRLRPYYISPRQGNNAGNHTIREGISTSGREPWRSHATCRRAFHDGGMERGRANELSRWRGRELLAAADSTGRCTRCWTFASRLSLSGRHDDRSGEYDADIVPSKHSTSATTQNAGMMRGQSFY